MGRVKTNSAKAEGSALACSCKYYCWPRGKQKITWH